MKAMTLKEYCELHKIAKTTLLFHLEKLKFPPCGSVQVSRRRPSYVWHIANLDMAKDRIKHRMVSL
jgi:hypothetical protein